MKNRLFWGLIASLVLMAGISSGVSAESTTPDKAGYTAADSEFYLDDQWVFFFRPGLVLTITDYEIPSDLRPLVTFTITDAAGRPLDLDGFYTPAEVDPRFFISYIPEGEEQIVNYVMGDRGPTYDHDGTFSFVELGTYTYKYATALPSDYDQSATHYIAAAARRDLRDYDLERYASNDVVTFVPNGSADPMPRNVVETDTCNRCHDPLAEHGSRYREVPVCEQCHNPDLVDDGVSYSFDVLVHRVHMEIGSEFPPELNDCSTCHTGGIPTEDLPMVANPNPAEACDANGNSQTTMSWSDEGKIQIHLNSADGKLFASGTGAGSAATGKWVKDGMNFVLVDADTGETIEEVPVYNTVLGCANNPPGTYRGSAGSQWDRWTSRPSRDVCGACHSNIDFATGENSADPDNPHPVQTNDDNCTICHKAYTGEEYDISVTGAHTVAYKSYQMPGILVKVISMQDTNPGKSPEVTFSISDKFGPIDPNSLNRMLFNLSGPNEDFSFYVQESVVGKAVPVEGTNNWTYSFTAKIPSSARGSYSLGVEGRKPATINPGEENEITRNDQMQNFIYAFAVTDDEPMARSQIVDDALCENCHSNLTLHGENRHDANGYCQTCHMADATDAVVRPTTDNPPESIHFNYMIHKIHRGEELQNGYVVYGYRSSVHDFGDVVFPGDLRNCESCHLEGTFGVPLPSTALPTFSPATPINPIMLPTTTACLSCHDSNEAAAHAEANTSANLGESCATCHGDGKTYSVDRVHAR